MTTEPVDRTKQLDRCVGRLLGKIRRTARRWTLLPEDERLGLAISGGTDSLAMAFLVHEHCKRMRRPMDLFCIHVRLDADGGTPGLPRATRAWMDERGLPYIEIEPRLDPREERLDCCGCAKIRRRALLETADAHDARFLALGHHADDVVETWLMSLMYSGTAEAIPPIRVYFSGAVTIVRPLYELKRGELHRVARLASLPEPVPACGRESDTRRERVRSVLGSLGADQALVRRRLFWAAVRQLDSATGPVTVDERR